MRVVLALVVAVVVVLCKRLPPARRVTLSPLYRALRARRSAARGCGIYPVIDPALPFFGFRFLLLLGQYRIGRRCNPGTLYSSFWVYYGALNVVLVGRLLYLLYLLRVSRVLLVLGRDHPVLG